VWEINSKEGIMQRNHLANIIWIKLHNFGYEILEKSHLKVVGP